MKQVKLFVGVDDYEVSLVFTWNKAEHAWVCMMDDAFMQELGPMPVQDVSLIDEGKTAEQPAPVQEPVAIALNTGTKQGVKWLKSVEHGMPLYTTPPLKEKT